MQMFNNDVSYLYSDEYLTSSSLNGRESPTKVSKVFEYQPIRTRVCQKIAPSLSVGHRSKHIILFGKNAPKRDRRRETNRIATRRLFEENLRHKIKQVEDEKSYLENYLTQHQTHKQDLENEIHNSFCMNSLTEVLLTDKEKIPSFFDQYSDGCEHFNMSFTSVLSLNNDLDDNFDS